MATTSLKKYDAAFAKVRKLAEAEYDKSFTDLVSSKNAELREKQLWRLTGVILKQQYSDPVPRNASSATKAIRTWVIDPARLRQRAERQTWDVDLLSQLVERRPNESVPAFALRLKRETSFARAFRKTLCNYICNESKIRKQVKAALRRAKLGSIAGWLTPEGIIQAGALTLAAKLVVVVPLLSTASPVLIAGAVVVIGTLGLDTFCKKSRKRKGSRKKQRSKPRSRQRA